VADVGPVSTPNGGSERFESSEAVVSDQGHRIGFPIPAETPASQRQNGLQAMAYVRSTPKPNGRRRFGGEVAQDWSSAVIKLQDVRLASDATLRPGRQISLECGQRLPHAALVGPEMEVGKIRLLASGGRNRRGAAGPSARPRRRMATLATSAR